MIAFLGALRQAVGGNQGAVQGQVGPTVFLRLALGLVEVRSVGGQHVDALVQVPVGSGLGQAEVAGQVDDPRRVAAPAQDELRLGPGRACPLVRTGVVGHAVAVQQAGEVVQGFSGYVADGRVDKHVGSLRRMVFLVENRSSREAPTPCHLTLLRQSPRVRPLAR